MEISSTVEFNGRWKCCKSKFVTTYTTMALFLCLFVLIPLNTYAQPPTKAPTIPFSNVSFQYNASYLYFFHEHKRSHLSEGTNQKWIYNVNSTTCARRCSYSAREEPDKILCRSFEFYPFEEPRAEQPYMESDDAGICVLNSATSETALLRQEDEGMTDAELVYTSHFTNRFESSHYTTIDFGGNTARPEFYDTDSSYASDYVNRVPWIGARMSAVVMEAPYQNPRHFMCVNVNASQTALVFTSNKSSDIFRAGFTPLDYTTSRCPGAVSKDKATALCTQLGASLCSQRDLRILFNEQLGCGIDGSDGVFPIWAAEDPKINDEELRFVKCCSRFRYAFDCSSYNTVNINKCNSLKTKQDCLRQGTGESKQNLYGFGRFLSEIRRGCLRDEHACAGTAFSEWTPRDQCVWCGNDCRPGSEFGVCNNQPILAAGFQKSFARICPPQSACELSAAYPDLYHLLVEPYEMLTGEDATRAPTRPKDCRIYRTAQDCAQHYDDCIWGSWYGTRVCRDIEKVKPPTFNRKKSTKNSKPNKKKNHRGLEDFEDEITSATYSNDADDDEKEYEL